MNDMQPRRLNRSLRILNIILFVISQISVVVRVLYRFYKFPI